MNEDQSQQKLKNKPEAELNLPGPVRLCGDRSEGGTRHLRIRGAERHVVKNIERLETELEVGSLRYLHSLQDRHVDIVLPVGAQISECGLHGAQMELVLAGRRRHKMGRVEGLAINPAIVEVQRGGREASGFRP